MSGHGGRRNGAGRKPALSPDESLILADECHRRLLSVESKRRNEVAKASLAKDPAITLADEHLRRLNAIPIADRLAWVAAGCPSETDDDEMDDTALPVILADRQSCLEKLPLRGRRVLIPRVYGGASELRAQIIREVSEVAEELIGRPVTVSRVATAWRDHIRHLKRLRSVQT